MPNAALQQHFCVNTNKRAKESKLPPILLAAVVFIFKLQH